MAAQHCDPPEHGGGPNHHTGSLTFGDGSRIGIARLGDEFALHVDFGVAVDVMYMDRDEARELALTLIDASQPDQGEEH